MAMAHLCYRADVEPRVTGHRCLMTASEPLNPFGSYQSAVARAVVGEPPSARWL